MDTPEEGAKVLCMHCARRRKEAQRTKPPPDDLLFDWTKAVWDVQPDLDHALGACPWENI